jgi:hypothetical protein
MPHQALEGSKNIVDDLDILSPDELRPKYRPTQIKILFVGESVPAGGTFFYKEDSILYHAMKEGFIRSFPEINGNGFLKSFSNLGCYLEDLCATPVNRLSDRERQSIRIDSVPQFRKKLEESSPQKIIVVMKQIVPFVQQAANDIDLQVPLHPLPFPISGNRQQFIAQLDQLLNSFQKEGLF